MHFNDIKSLAFCVYISISLKNVIKVEYMFLFVKNYFPNVISKILGCFHLIKSVPFTLIFPHFWKKNHSLINIRKSINFRESWLHILSILIIYRENVFNYIFNCNSETYGQMGISDNSYFALWGEEILVYSLLVVFIVSMFCPYLNTYLN